MGKTHQKIHYLFTLKQKQNENTSSKYKMILPDQEKGPYSLS